MFTEAGVTTPDPPIISHGAQTAIGHEPGHGLILAQRADRARPLPAGSGLGLLLGHDADVLRRNAAGRARRVRRPLPPGARARAADRPARESSGAELHRIASEVFSEAGHPTQLTKEPGEPLDEGFFHSLGHGVGLEVHEEPGLGRSGAEIVAGDVLAVEPGCYRTGFGGCRLEDLVLVTEDGYELLTHFPYDLEV